MEKYLFLREMPSKEHLGLYVTLSESNINIEVIYHAANNRDRTAPTSTVTYSGPFSPEVLLRITPECYKHDNDFTIEDESLGEIAVTKVRAFDENGKEFILGGLISFVASDHGGQQQRRIDTVSPEQFLSYQEQKQRQHLAQPA